MTLPTLTWNIVGPYPIQSGSYYMPALAKPKQHVMQTIIDLVGSSSYWQVDVQDVTGSAIEGLVLKPKPATSATPNMRVVVTMNASASLGGSATADKMAMIDASTPETFVANCLMMGFTPDVTPNPTWVTGSWNSDRPWGNTVRWSKYYHCDASNTYYIDKMYLVESSETLWIGLKGKRGDTRHCGLGAGAYIASFDTGSGEVDGRVYALTSVKSQMGTTPSNVATAGPFGHYSADGQDHCEVFIVSGGVPNGPTSAGSNNNNQCELVFRNELQTHAVVTTRHTDGGDHTPTYTAGERLVLWPVNMFSVNAPYRYAGRLRQIYLTAMHTPFMSIVSASNGQVLGYTLSQDEHVSFNSWFFSNT